jgi:hypothetical protein
MENLGERMGNTKEEPLMSAMTNRLKYFLFAHLPKFSTGSEETEKENNAKSKGEKGYQDINNTNISFL